MLLLAAALALTGCASEPRTGPGLADAKSIVQLVRNEASERIPTASVAAVEIIADESQACGTAADDPKETRRRWAATSVVTLAPGAGDTLESTYADLINSFSGDGWSEVSYDGDGAVSLQKPESEDTIAFLATPMDADAGTPASITIAIVSGCVLTGGAGSAEVALLEDAAGD